MTKDTKSTEEVSNGEEQGIDYKAENERLEKELFDLKQKNNFTDEKKKNENLKSRIQKLKNSSPATTEENEEPKEKDDNFTMEDVIALDKQGFSSSSEEAKIIKKMADALGINTISEALGDKSIQAKLEEINIQNNASEILNDDSDDSYLSDKEATLEKYANGEIPKTEKELEIIARANLSSQGVI